MLKKLVFASATIGILFSASIALAQTNSASTTPPKPVIFPIAELGGCASKDVCRVYCDVSEHHEACYTYALSHALMRKDEVEKARELNKAVGPGGCMGVACKLYCNEPLNQVVCRAFAEEHHIVRPNASTTPRTESLTPQRTGTTTLPGPAAERAKIELLLKTSTGPGECKTVDACKAYCADSAHNTECLVFAKNHLLMKVEEVDRAQNFVKMRDGDRATSTLKRIATSTLPKPPLPKPGDMRASTTQPKLKLDERPYLGSTTPKINKNTDGIKPPTQQGIGVSSSNIDYSKPPYTCTEAQASEGACDPNQLPGYVPPHSDQGGAVYNAFHGVLHYFGF